MMDQKRWEQLKDYFDHEELFWEDNSSSDPDVGGCLMEWLECDSTCPSWKMIKEFNDHGYRVYASERDSFGWLIGVVQERKTGKKIYFG